jgi:hypothetical protein
MALLGLRNEQEFYSDYYLEAIFKSSLKNPTTSAIMNQLPNR